ncbi:MAG TPA: hypothetical protein VIF14_01970 [Alphaproteobacteria bacterium]|jgi:hypothetical protein
MILAFSRGAALALAAALPPVIAPPLALGQDARVLIAEANPELQKRADALFKGIGEGGGKVTYGALEAGATPEGLIIKQIEIVSPDKKKFTIDEIAIKAFDWSNPKEPRYADVEMKKLVVTAESLDAEAAVNFRELGLTALTIGGALAFKFDETEKTFDVTKLHLDFAEMGELVLRLKLTGITAADLKSAVPGEKPPAGKPNGQDPQAMMGLLSRLNIAGAAIAFKDKSLVERMIRADAKKKNLSEQAAKAKMLDELAAERGKAEDDVTKEIIDAAIKFLRNPGEIELALSPPAPANVMAAFMMVMGNRATFKQMMGMSVSVK